MAAPRCRAVVLEAMASQEAMGCAPGRAALSYMMPSGPAARRCSKWPVRHGKDERHERRQPRGDSKAIRKPIRKPSAKPCSSAKLAFSMAHGEL